MPFGNVPVVRKVLETRVLAITPLETVLTAERDVKPHCDKHLRVANEVDGGARMPRAVARGARDAQATRQDLPN